MLKEDQGQIVKNIVGYIQGVKEFIIECQMGVFRCCDLFLVDKVEEMLGMKKKFEDLYIMVV